MISASAQAQDRPALRLSGVSKHFGATRALVDVAIEVRAGEIRGLVGRNGSGKSTLIKILSGYHEPGPGAVLEVAGKPVELPLRPGAGRELGLAFVHQDLGLLPGRSVLENLRAGRYSSTWYGRVPWKDERNRAGEALARFGVEIDLDARVADLRLVDRATVAIVRGLMDLEATGGAGVLVLDEATAYLPRDGVERLFLVVRSIAAQGMAVLFVSHRLDEVLRLTETVSVIRDGALVGTVETASATEERLIEMILGTQMEDYYPEPPSRRSNDTLISVEGMTGAIVRNVAVSIHRGEVLGLTGIAGSGYEEIPYLLFGAKVASFGTLRTVDASVVELASLRPALATEFGMALLPADRQHASGVPGISITHNVSLPILRRYWRGGRLRGREEQTAARRMIADYDLRLPSPRARLGQLSGGNQQKALLAKWLQRSPQILLLDEPTQGVDVGAKKDIFKRLEAVAEGGAAILIASTEYEDLAHICHRVLVFRDGVVAAELTGADLTEERIIERCYRKMVN